MRFSGRGPPTAWRALRPPGHCPSPCRSRSRLGRRDQQEDRGRHKGKLRYQRKLTQEQLAFASKMTSRVPNTPRATKSLPMPAFSGRYACHGPPYGGPMPCLSR
jgi:hypothetical protein